MEHEICLGGGREEAVPCQKACTCICSTDMYQLWDCLGWRSRIMGGEVGSVVMEEKIDNFTILTKTSPLDNKSYYFSANILSLLCQFVSDHTGNSLICLFLIYSRVLCLFIDSRIKGSLLDSWFPVNFSSLQSQKILALTCKLPWLGSEDLPKEIFEEKLRPSPVLVLRTD